MERMESKAGSLSCLKWVLGPGHGDLGSAIEEAIYMDHPRGTKWMVTSNPLGFKHHPLEGAGK